MKRMIAAAVLALSLVPSAAAGVKGNTYSSQTGCLYFRQDGVLYNGQAYQGTFTEVDLVFLSFWRGRNVATDEEIRGVSFLFGLGTTYELLGRTETLWAGTCALETPALPVLGQSLTVPATLATRLEEPGSGAVGLVRDQAQELRVDHELLVELRALVDEDRELERHVVVA